jgi:uncharacterized protein
LQIFLEPNAMPKRAPVIIPKLAHHWGSVTIQPGESAEVALVVSESYSSLTIPIPVFVFRGLQEGPTVFVSAALHGDEINGTGAIRSLICDHLFELQRGTLILVPVVNLLGFDRHSRYLPDRRDLNRSFPGSKQGSLASRMARLIFEEIVGRSNYGIDLHTAAVRRTNFPNVRADMSRKEVARIANAFGCEIILNTKGPEKSLRRQATLAGCPTIILEAGEVWKVERAVVEYMVGGVISVLAELDMVEAQPRPPAYQVLIEHTSWVRASRGGFLSFHVSPGDLVHAGDPLATNTSLTGVEKNVLSAPFDGVVLGMTTLPSISPGDPVCHLGRITSKHGEIDHLRTKGDHDLHDRTHEDLSTNVHVVERVEEEP